MLLAQLHDYKIRVKHGPENSGPPDLHEILLELNTTVRPSMTCMPATPP